MTPDLKEWLAQFAGEYYGASIPVKADKSRPYKSAIHKTMKQVKKARDANNWRNNDVYGANRANGLLFDVQDPLSKQDGWYITNPEYTEVSLITKLDERQDQEQLTLVEYLDCRDVMDISRVLELDHYFQKMYDIGSMGLPLLSHFYKTKKLSKRKIEVALEMGRLKEILEKLK